MNEIITRVFSSKLLSTQESVQQESRWRYQKRISYPRRYEILFDIVRQ
jgi:hypothetical protein